MAENTPKRKRKRILECPILTAASIPLPPRVECCVFGCRSSDCDPVSFHQLPREPTRWSQWLKLINRQDLADKLASGHCSAQICSLHFLPEQMPDGVLVPNALPTLLLPSTSNKFVYDGASTLLSVLVKPEVDEEIIEIKTEPEQPPTCTFQEKTTNAEHFNQPDPIQIPEPYQLPARIQSPGPIQLNQILQRPYESSPQAHFNPEVILPDPQLFIIITPMKSEPSYFDFQVNAEAQTNVTEAFSRIATFSAVEQINIPPAETRLTGVSNKSASVQTGPELVEVFSAELRRKHALDMEEAYKKLKDLERPHMEKLQFLKGCDKHLNEKIANFIKSHAYLSEKYVGKKYPADFKSFTLKLYLWNPKSYRYVERFFDLPSKGGIERFRMPIKSGVNETLMEALKVKVDQMTAVGKMCAVCFDVMCLKKNLYYDVCYDYLCGMQEVDDIVEHEPAKYAAVIAVRGLYGRWKQPVSYALVAEKKQHPALKAWLHNTITSLFNIGLNVKALVTDSNEEFLDVSIKEPYFEINERKIHHIYDVTDLFKSARDELMQYDFHIGDGVAKWKHIISVYDQDREQELQLMPHVTDKHVRPDATSKNDVKLATQLFSSSVAAAMYFHIVVRLQDKQVNDTVQFIAKMSSIFDILYSRKLADAYRATSSQQRFLKDTLEYLKTIKLKDKYGNVFESKFVTGLAVSIKSLMSLIAVQKKTNVNYLLTKNLSKDFMQTYFEKIKRLSNSKVTPIKFTRAFRRLYISNLLNNTKTPATGDDMTATLSKIAAYVKADMEKEETDDSTSLSVGVSDYKVDWPSNEYIAGYLLSKCLERHSCDRLIGNLCDYYRFESKTELIEAFQFYNADNINKLCKIRPPTHLREFVHNMEIKFIEHYRSSNVKNMKFGHNMYRVMESVSFKLLCPCFPIKFLKMLYIRLKIYSSVKIYKQII